MEPEKRRPIASRNWRISGVLARTLASHGVSPNAISVAGMCCGIGAGVCFAQTTTAPPVSAWFWLAGAVLVQLRLLANMLDGMVAVETDRCSPVGELFNELPDRVSDTAIFVGLGYAAGGSPTFGYLAAFAAMATAYVRTACASAGAPPDFRGPMAKQHRMFLVTCLAILASFVPADRAWGNFLGYPATTTLMALTIVVVGATATVIGRVRSAARALREIS